VRPGLLDVEAIVKGDVSLARTLGRGTMLRCGKSGPVIRLSRPSARRLSKPGRKAAEDSRLYGVPADPDLAFLRGAELIQVCLDLHQLPFHFHPAGSIYVQGKWELRDASGLQIDGCQDGADRPPYQLHRVLECFVTA